VFTIISYSFLFATLIASAGSFFYKDHIQKNETAIMAELSKETADFDEVGMQQVQEFDRRLIQASGRLNTTVSTVTIFEALEAATINNVLIEALSIERIGDESLQVVAQIETDSFDATLFQRSIYNINQTIGTVEIKDVQALNLDADTIPQSDSSQQRLPTVSFTAEFDVLLSDIPYVAGFSAQSLPLPVMEITPQTEQFIEDVSTTQSAAFVEQANNNQNNI